jgi:hypothetical protein
VTGSLIEESGMQFGPFDVDDCFLIEQSGLYQRIRQGVKISEMAVLNLYNQAVFVAANIEWEIAIEQQPLTADRISPRQFRTGAVSRRDAGTAIALRPTRTVRPIQRLFHFPRHA